jgi:hypothetical protein
MPNEPMIHPSSCRLGLPSTVSWASLPIMCALTVAGGCADRISVDVTTERRAEIHVAGDLHFHQHRHFHGHTAPPRTERSRVNVDSDCERLRREHEERIARWRAEFGR